MATQRRTRIAYSLLWLVCAYLLKEKQKIPLGDFPLCYNSQEAKKTVHFKFWSRIWIFNRKALRFLKCVCPHTFLNLFNSDAILFKCWLHHIYSGLNLFKYDAIVLFRRQWRHCRRCCSCCPCCHHCCRHMAVAAAAAARLQLFFSAAAATSATAAAATAAAAADTAVAKK